MSTTAIAPCGCPIPPEVASGEVQSLGWHLRENHPEVCTNPTGWFAFPKIRWSARQPTVEECEDVGRDPSYADTSGASSASDWGDYVVETSDDDQGKELLARAFEAFAMCDAAHVIPAGVYLEE